MPRGGRRSTTWNPTWKHGQTKTIRVPIALAESLVNLARILDEGKEVFLDLPTNSEKVISSSNSLVTGNSEQAIPFSNSLVTGNKVQLLSQLEDSDLNLAIEAIATVISLKDIAISRELKKRSRTDRTTIAIWQKEIKSLERTIEVLKSMSWNQ